MIVGVDWTVRLREYDRARGGAGLYGGEAMFSRQGNAAVADGFSRQGT